MNIKIEVSGELSEVMPVLTVLAGGQSAQPAKKAAAAPAAKVDQEETQETKTAAQPAKVAAAKPATAAKAAQPAKVAAAKPAVLSDEDKLAALEGQDADEQLATVQAEVTKHSKKGKTADIKKLLAIFDSPKVSELDPAVYGEFYGLVLRFAGGETADDIVESYDI